MNFLLLVNLAKRYFKIRETTPAPTVRSPSRMEKRIFNPLASTFGL
ncbi:hypothetical protein [Tychonema sp. LEGE 06208]|nr:hypothetical protein [Tychonema sp. LEGE 06208]